MIDLTDAELQSLTWEPVVSSWLGSRFLGDVPVTSGKTTWSRLREVQGSLDLTVPRWAAEHEGEAARDWSPAGDASHPLSHHGQTLAVAIRVTTQVTGRSWLRQCGRFLITRWTAGIDTVTITGASAAGQKILDDRFWSPQPTLPGGSFGSELRRLVPSTIGMLIDAGLVDRGVPSMSWPESRMSAVQEIASTWPARLRETGDGMIAVLPPLGEWTPGLVLTDGESGTVVEATPEGSREGIYNVVVARGQSTTDAGVPDFQGVAEQSTGPYATSAYGSVVRFFSSPLITSQHAAAQTAATLLATELAPATTLPVVCASDPRITLDQPVTIRTHTPDQRTVDRHGWVSGFSLPLTHASDMTLDVEIA